MLTTKNDGANTGPGTTGTTADAEANQAFRDRNRATRIFDL
ncbi:unnamed protein product [marine sediment metagenome]|uniref:Uncharacterized protein n=1 Tax=marine sediment metagenome TaxID=412755 RepID=X1KCA2_9ZZZZ